jgi:DNA-binding response OmpR family regulator
VAEVLVVDDDPVARTLITDWLTEAGHRVSSADSGTAMLKQLLTRPAAVVLLDVGMPGMTGDRLPQILAKSLEPPLPRVVLLSALSEAELRVLVRKSGAAGHLSKTCTRAQLLAMVEAQARYFADSGRAGLVTAPGLADPKD